MKLMGMYTGLAMLMFLAELTAQTTGQLEGRPLHLERRL